MQLVQTATAVRQNWGQFIDSVVRDRPQFVRRNRDTVVAFGEEQLRSLFENLRFHADTLAEDDGSITLALQEVDLVANGDTEAEALEEIAELVIDYANEYYDNFELYYRAPNRKRHLPFVMSVLIQEDIEGVKSLITCLPGGR